MPLQAQPCYCEGINEGPGPDVALPEAPPEFADRKGRTDTDGARRAAYAASLGPEGFAQLLARIDRAHAQVSTASHLLICCLPRWLDRLPSCDASTKCSSRANFSRPCIAPHAG